MKKNFSMGFICGVLLVSILVGGLYTADYFYNKDNVDISDIMTGDESQLLETNDPKMRLLKSYIDTYYLEDVDDETLRVGLYKGMFEALGDPYSEYYTEEEYKEIMESLTGEFCGIGVLVTQDPEKGTVNVIEVYEDSAAQEGGMLAEDIIYKVEGEEVIGQDLDQVVAKIRGEEGTKVNVTVYRTSTNEYIDMELTRKKVTVKTVKYEMLDEENKIGYIQISSFDSNTDEMFSEAMKDLQGQGMKSIIFDVRSNPGGMYDTVCNMLDELLPEGTIVYTIDKNDVKAEEKSDANCVEMPMVVLANGDSASASEIFCGALQDYGVAKIMGTQTFGKGIVQSTIPLVDGSAVKLTISKYYTPNGVNIHGVGITPDIVVEQDKDTEADEQLDRALEELKK